MSTLASPMRSPPRGFIVSRIVGAREYSAHSRGAQQANATCNRKMGVGGHGFWCRSQNIVAFEKHMATTPDPRTGKLRHPNTPLTYLSSFSGVFTVAVQQLLIDTNPMDKVAIGSKIESKRQPYSVEQVTLILNRAQYETDEIFLSLLTEAYTGCRISEIVDCGTRDFNFVKSGDPETVIPGQWFLFIGEDHREPGLHGQGAQSPG